MAKALPRNAELADQLDLLADVSEILGEESFKIIAYRRAAARIRETPSPVAELALAGRAKELPASARRSRRRCARSPSRARSRPSRRRERVPEGVVDFLRLPGVGQDRGPHLDPARRDDPGRASGRGRGGRLRGLSGMGARSGRRSSPHSPQGRAGRSRPRARACSASRCPRSHVSSRSSRASGGDRGVRGGQREASPRDGARPRPDRHFDRPGGSHRGLLRGVPGSRRSSRAVTRRRRSGAPGAPARPPVVPPECYGTCSSTSRARRTTTSSCVRAQRRGLSISEYGVTVVESDEVVTHASEEELYEYLGYQPIPPELREGNDELAAARKGALPRLVELADLVGELHCHSTWSADGRDSIEEMARTAGPWPALPVRDRPLALPPQRPARGPVAGDRGGARADRLFASSAGSRRTSARTARSTCRTTSSRSSTGWSRRCTRPSSAARPSAFSPRSTTRTSTVSDTSRGGSS